jgi:5S rRNA maturation endonuclease (ribonuclease M5)
MMMSQVNKEKLKDAVLVEQYYRDQLGEPEKTKSDHWIYFCPFHEDRKTPNLAVYYDGHFKCFACDAKGGDILAFHQQKHKLTFPETLKELAEKYAPHLLSSNGIPNGKQVAVYPYNDESGHLLFQVVRYSDPKDFRQRRPDGKGGWVWKLNGVRKVLYRQPELIASDGPVYIVAGEKDVETMRQHGLTATTNPGGEGKWRQEYNEFLKDRDVVILEDNDQQGQKHGRMVSENLDGTAKSIKIIRFTELQEKSDVSDFLAAHSVNELKDKVDAAPLFDGSYAEYFGEPEAEIIKTSKACVYEFSDNGIVWNKPTKDGPVPTPLTNFTAQIVAQIERDDGAEIVRNYEIEAKLKAKPFHFSITASEYSSFNWVDRELGAESLVYPGYNIKDNARAGIKVLSGHIKSKKVYAHFGWTKIKGDWVYLHAEGAIGKDGPVSGIEVDSGNTKLSDFVLPDPPDSDERITAIQDTFALLDLAPARIMIPAICSVFLAPLGCALTPDNSIFFVGPTGTGKTEITALMQAHFGSGFNGRNLPGNWSSTANALERQAFLVKDVVFTIDDFAPGGTVYDVAKLHREAARVLRAQGNQSGRGRMGADSSLRPEYYPRGIVVSSGEDIPKGQSIRGRTVVIEVSPSDIDFSKLTEAQRMAAEGKYAQTMAGFVKRLASKMNELKKTMPQRKLDLREEARKSPVAHNRTPEITANLMVACEEFLKFALESGAIDEDKRKELHTRFWNALGEVAKSQADHQIGEDPVTQFMELLLATISSRRGHIADIKDGGPPKNAVRWG